ncbi:unnamed protein product [Cylicocyclus nassatus]|uniref:Uncharacterized protein n=1 Tax=Cylicocyclus nassatus TaxID=53992 RepID=A0AA36DT95_CYLNA|nr:unnamed protein product [Cylicocyclus nassatus]
MLRQTLLIILLVCLLLLCLPLEACMGGASAPETPAAPAAAAPAVQCCGK